MRATLFFRWLRQLSFYVRAPWLARIASCYTRTLVIGSYKKTDKLINEQKYMFIVYDVYVIYIYEVYVYSL